MKFVELAAYFEKIEHVSSRLTITSLLAELFNKLSPEELEKTVYLLQGKVVPSFQKIEFGMAEKTVIKAIVLALNIDKSYFEKESKKMGDLGKAVEFFKKQFISFEEKALTILDTHKELYKIAVAGGDKSQEYKINSLSFLIRQLDPLSTRYLVRIPLALMRLGFSDMTVLDAYSWMIGGDKTLRPLIEHAYHVRPDLGYIGRILKEKGIKEMQKIQPVICTPIIMMRAERLSSGKEIIDQIGECAIEPKYDGFRLQIHYKKENNKAEVRLFSRSLEDVTYMYPDVIEGVKKQIIAKEIIFEGEAIGFDPTTGSFLPFQETVQRKRKYDIIQKAKEIPLKLFSFDLLYLNGINYIHEPFVERRKQLETVIQAKGDVLKDIVVLAPHILMKDPVKIEKNFDTAIAQGLEGIIAKKLNGTYQPGARGWNWIKFKRSYSSKINDTIDCLVMGYDFGKGKRTDFGIGAFLVGIFDKRQEKYATVAKIGTGLTDEEWRTLELRSKKLESKIKPDNYYVDKQMVCDVWISPSIVVEIRADEITKSPVHTAGLALRFPRLERFRDDKRETDTTTLSELKKMLIEQEKV
ncbi:hypothetical protein A2334_00070 [Candidatus Roizmanbacteria bacterium RIFOXYB2_FULL_38_10]|uniref:Probable DNA ligase n=1 Tax=Candidatus Roizmanbacteria bacterium RIFOXYD1_FULL_38_12 TaxID=1802093 RepID=A0A1F7L2E9_9BACT|nr:MAG: hypothetical protein A3K47_06065 [Candidatus Roizmanbacteria bacterium RIFOXYA2_FULL_38_14]OGK64305.1 MAG: hypothetical protein A3K27_06065 [Candidatus Roizmanbacteria bacterium RIFOXYA1_FULL_37_12]OGK66151.1 MAG: hypothetical protein A3K38_06065 [Candidatus Roizmanbacteria bacterium RIFOXYB1_FULL_40_23]OGK67830.1 MAG: hypothetical protein A2334_00070 [Candidatus Roizmanbacteria bacterium RIFOXYB2_FULL_38_10]OGK70556.1 MAG: hypothetical protein A3K21_06075 [Candidatus Roizmanbacteria ba